MTMTQKERLRHLDNYRLYTLTELESVVGVTHRTLLNYVKEGRIKATKIGGKWKVSEDNLKAFVNPPNILHCPQNTISRQ